MLTPVSITKTRQVSRVPWPLSTDRPHRHWLARTSSTCQSILPTRLPGAYGMVACGVGTRLRRPSSHGITGTQSLPSSRMPGMVPGRLSDLPTCCSATCKVLMPLLWACLPTSWLSMLPRFARCVPGTTTASSSCGVVHCLSILLPAAMFLVLPTPTGTPLVRKSITSSLPNSTRLQVPWLRTMPTTLW